MIDVSKCVLEETFTDEGTGCKVAYFTYPKELGEAIIGNVEHEEEGDIVSYCISMAEYGDRTFELSMSPTVECDDGLSDVCWCDLRCGVDYNDDTIQALLNLAKIN